MKGLTPHECDAFLADLNKVNSQFTMDGFGDGMKLARESKLPLASDSA